MCRRKATAAFFALVLAGCQGRGALSRGPSPGIGTESSPQPRVSPTIPSPPESFLELAQDLAASILTNLVTAEGGVLSYVRPDHQEEPSLSGTGHELTSESVGLALGAYLALGDKGAMSLVHSFWRSHFLSPAGLSSWKLTPDGRPAASEEGYLSAAPIDELRLARVLLAAGPLLPHSREDAEKISRSLLSALRGGLIPDDVSWREGQALEPGERISLSYLDIGAMKALLRLDARWEPVLAASLRILLRAARPGGPPWQVYDPEAEKFSCQDPCDTIHGLWIGLRLQEAGEEGAALRILSFYRTLLDRSGRLDDAYTPEGSGSGEEDLASYALLARLAWRLGEKAFARSVVEERILPFRSSSGLYTQEPPDASSFQNLEVLLTLLELSGRRAPAD